MSSVEELAARTQLPGLRGLTPLLCALVLFLPLYRLLSLDVGPVNLSIVDALTILGGAYLALAFAIGHRVAWPAGWFSAFLALYALAVTASIARAHAPGVAVHYLLALGLNVLLFVVAYQIIRSRRALLRFSAVYCVAAGALALVAIVQGLPELGGYATRSLAGTLSARNEMVYLLLPGFAIGLANALGRGPHRLFFATSAALIITAIVLSRGRTGLVLCLVVLLLAPLVARRRLGVSGLARTCALWILVLVPAASVLFTAPGQGLLRRYTSSTYAELVDQRGSAWARYLVFQGALAAFQSRPLFGIGADNFKGSSGLYIATGVDEESHDLSAIQPHSTYLGALAETGLVGLAGLLGLVACGLVTFRRLRLADDAIRGAVAGVLLGFFSLAAYLVVFDAGVRPLTWLFLALALAVREILGPVGKTSVALRAS